MNSSSATALRAREGWATFAVIIVWLGFTAWSRPLMLPDEGRYAAVAWEMIRSGDWLTPTLNGMPFFHKPPLFYWITATALALTGVNEFAARAASLLGASLGAFSLYWFTRRWCSPVLARRALIVLLVQPLFFLGAQFANLDMLVAGCITATILMLAHVALSFERGEPQRGALLLAYALAALGVLAKGLIGIVIPGMVIGLWLILRRRWSALWHLISVPGVLLFLAIAGPWFVLMQERFDGFLHYFFVVQHFQRYTESGFNNMLPFWFYPVAVLVGSMPCIFWARSVFTRHYNAGDDVRAAVRQLMGLGVLLVLVFFSLPKSKLIGYILPVIAPLAWLMADASMRDGEDRVRQRKWLLTLACSALIGLIVVTVLSVDHRRSNREVAIALNAQLQAGEPVYMLESYDYDVPFYARLQTPVVVVDDWSDPRIAKRDNWRKELVDAGVFDKPIAQRVLVRPDDLPAALCAHAVAWVIGNPDAAKRFAFLLQEVPVTTSNGASLWRVQTQKSALLNCAGTPNADSANK